MTRTNNALVKLSGEDVRPGGVPAGPVSIPLVDVTETADGYVLALDMPGAGKESISVSVLDGLLAVKAPVSRVHDGAAVVYREIRRGWYERRFTLGEGIDRNAVEAAYDNGVLTVRLRKTDAAKPREIVIR